jgi:hypothetical protein
MDTDPLAAGQAALQTADWPLARRHFEAALAEAATGRAIPISRGARPF